VGSLKPNDFGLFDMHGSLWEWCQDAVRPYTAGDVPREDWGEEEKGKPVESTTSRVLRGGSFFYNAGDVRAANRNTTGPAYRPSDAGFRPARTYAAVP
jgi:formylglycine-generating enzyme required for sulfatase activity